MLRTLRSPLAIASALKGANARGGFKLITRVKPAYAPEYEE